LVLAAHGPGKASHPALLEREDRTLVAWYRSLGTLAREGAAATTPGRYKPGLAIATSSTPCAIRSWRRIGSRTSGGSAPCGVPLPKAHPAPSHQRWRQVLAGTGHSKPQNQPLKPRRSNRGTSGICFQRVPDGQNLANAQGAPALGMGGSSVGI
jgi:hypothetical protein